MHPNKLGKAKKRQATTRPDDASANVAPVVNSTRQREPNRLPLGASKVERIEWLARRFETIAADLRLMREQDTKADHLLNNTHCKAVQASRGRSTAATVIMGERSLASGGRSSVSIRAERHISDYERRRRRELR